MLELKKIVKHYVLPTVTVQALKGIDLSFRKNEFVAILGPSGCGKTTLLNIIGGLDRYTTGDLIIKNKSTKEYKNSDWDAYRNRSIGFVFQNYNLITHQKVIHNVELALTLSGVSKNERFLKAKAALESVGLADQLYKKPNELSGGQMQRVAIARALVNDPEILLADEPTGALDSVTSRQIMDILKEISKERLVIMVTHNQEIANTYASRIITLLDGEVTSDSSPYKVSMKDTVKAQKKNRTSMNFFTALSLSFKNLITKKTRTIMTSFAGSIGIIGIALVLSLSNGFGKYIDKLQADTLSNFPISVGQTAFIQPDTFRNPMWDLEEFPPTDVIVPKDTSNVFHQNTITDEYVTYLSGLEPSTYNAITYTRSVQMNVLSEITENNVTTYQNIRGILNELIDNETFLLSQYDVMEGRLPEEKHEMVLIVDNYNRLSANVFSNLGLSTENDATYTFNDFLGKTFKYIPNNTFYTYSSDLDRFLQNTLSNFLYTQEAAIELEIVGVLRGNSQTSLFLLEDGLYYPKSLTDFVLADAMLSDIVIAQLEAGVSKNVITGQPFTNETQLNTSLRNLGGISTPKEILIYPTTFEDKAIIRDYLDAYNTDLEDADRIIYTDFSEVVTKMMNTLIDTISYVLIAFAGISLVVSSIMIGIITYVSVIERTKEIGILRSIGARKKDISRVFNAETIIIGFTAGTFGVLLGALLTVPTNAIINNLVVGVNNVAILNPLHGLLLIVISVTLTLISGLVPSRIAANKDPVKALRID